MTTKSKTEPRATVRLVRCAVYTRKSTEEGLEQEFNSLDAQREAGEAYVRSQAGEGWVLNPDRYDDGGFTGGNTDRPGLRRLMSDIEGGRVDCVVVYKVDRLSLRGVLDQARALRPAWTAELAAEERGLARNLSAWYREATRLSVQLRPGGDNGDVVGRLAELHDRIGTVEGRVKQVRDHIRAVAGQVVDEGAAARALAAFDPVWGTLTPREQARVVGLLVEAVTFDGRTGTVAFRPAGLTTLARELTTHTPEEDVA